MYDFAHGLSDYVEGITHSICTPRVRGAPPALRMAPRGPRPAAGASAPARVRPPQRHLHHHEQAQAAPPGAGRARQWLGRPAHAHHLGHATARLPGRVHPRLLRPHRGGETREHGADRAARALRPRVPQPPGAARHGRAAPAQGSHRELPRGSSRGDRGHQQPRG